MRLRYLAAAFMLSACGEPEAPPAPSIVGESAETAPAPPAEPASAPTAPASAPVVPVAAPRTSDDVMYFVVRDGGGLVRLGADGFRRIREQALRLRAAPDGPLHLLWRDDGHYYVTVVSGGPENTIEAPASIAWVQGIAPVANGGVWAIGGTGLAFHDGSTWMVIPQQRGRDYRDIAVGSDGTVWAVGMHGIFRRNGDAIDEVPVAAVIRPPYNHFVIGAPQVTVSHQHGLLGWDGRAWTPVRLPAPVAHYVRYRADGAMVVHRSTELVVVQPDGREQTIALASLGAPAARHMGTVEWDGSGRLWVDTDAGLSVLAPDLTTLARHFPRGSIPELRGGIDQMFARGAGPPLPAAREPDGHVHGTFRFQNAPLANAVFDLCADPHRTPGSWGTPCEGMPTVGGGTTRADGTFDLWEVPEGLYDFGIRRPDGSWYITSNTPCCTPMQRGRVLEVPPIDVPARRGR